MSDALQQVMSVVTAWKTLGVLAGLAAAALLLVRFIKSDGALAVVGKIPWVGAKLQGFLSNANRRPWLAAGLTGLAAFFSAMGSGKGWVASLAALFSGGLGGLVAVGAHQLVDRSSQPDAHAVADALRGALEQANTQRQEQLQAAVARVQAMTPEALAAFASANPPPVPTNS